VCDFEREKIGYILPKGNYRRKKDTPMKDLIKFMERSKGGFERIL